MEKQTVATYDIAREANASTATVSRVINGNPNVKPATRKRVLGVINHLDYRPNAIARGLASKKAITVGVIIPGVSNVFFASLVRGIDDITTMYKYNIILANSDGDDQKEVTMLNDLLAKQIDGIIFMDHRIIGDIRDESSRSETPVVLAGSIGSDEQVGSVNIDYIEATGDATATLAKNGDKEVAFVSGTLIDPTNDQSRMKGYKEALAEDDLSYNENLVSESEYESETGISLAERVRNNGTTAASITDDGLTIGPLDGMLDTGVKVPEEFEIITSNSSLLTGASRPHLSSITQPLHDIGAVSVRLLAKLMNKGETEEKTVVLPYGIGQKGSTK